MKQLRYWIAGLGVWLFFLYNIERLGHPVNIASFVYPFALVCVIAIIILPWLRRILAHWQFLITLPLFFLLKLQLGYAIGGSNLSTTVTEICAIGLSVLLSGQIAWRLDELHEAVAMVTTTHLTSGTHPFEHGQGRVYREIRRARRFQRPATLLAIKATPDSARTSLNRFIQEAQNEIIDKYISARIAHLLVEELRDCDVITYKGDNFIVLLPETERENSSGIIEQLEKAAQEKLGLNFNIGSSTFPDEAVTFESLLERAESRMNDIAPISNDAPDVRMSQNAPNILQM